MAPSYPTAPTADVVDVLHGERVPDPYRPLEDSDAPATVAWVAAENEESERFLAAVPSRAGLRSRIAELWDYPKQGAPFERGGRWFQMRNSGLQAQSVLYVADGPGQAGEVLIDPNGLSEDGTVSLTGLGVSDDGKSVAWATSSGGSDWMTWRVRDVATGADREDVVEWSKFSQAAWSGDGFYYTAVQQPEPGAELTEAVSAARIAFHGLGAAGPDPVEFEAPDHGDWIPNGGVTDDGRYLVVSVSKGTAPETYVLVRDLADPAAPLQPLNPVLEAMDRVLEHAGDGTFFVHTDRGAERGRIVRASVGSDPGDWPEVVPEGPDTLTDAHLCGGRLVCHYLHNAASVVRVFEADGTFVHEVGLPGPASVVEISGR